MPYHLVQEADLVSVTMSGVVTVADLRSLAAEGATLEARLPVSPHRLLDLRHCTGLRLDFGALLEITDLRTRAVLRNPVKSALVAQDAVHYGFARMFQDLNRNPDIIVGIFSDDEMARAWLLLPGLEPPNTPWVPA